MNILLKMIVFIGQINNIIQQQKVQVIEQRKEAFCMPAQWTVNFVGQMHYYSISKKKLSKKLGFSPEYTGKLLKMDYPPKGTEQKFKEALADLIQQQEKSRPA